MKKIFTPLFVLITGSMFAQPVIGSDVMGSIGETITLNNFDAEGFDPGPDGNNVTWDFTGITLDGTSFEYTLLDASGTPYASDFPGANIALESGVGVYSYSKITATEYSNYGVGSAAIIMFYSDPEKIFSFPITFESTHTDDFYAEFTSGVDFVRSGSVKATCDGFGTLKLPSGIFTNVARVKVEEDYEDDADILPSPNEYNFDLYYWLQQGVDGPLLSYFHQEITTVGVTTTTETGNVNANPFGTAIEQPTDQLVISIYPNPASDVVSINAPGIEHVELYNALGQLVGIQTDIYNETLTLSVNELPEGIYLLQITTLTGTTAAKIRIQ